MIRKILRAELSAKEANLVKPGKASVPQHRSKSVAQKYMMLEYSSLASTSSYKMMMINMILFQGPESDNIQPTRNHSGQVSFRLKQSCPQVTSIPVVSKSDLT